ncbi:hypothetical protein SmaMPs15_000041 [Stenotrophomonas maltophilia phage vB_SmaM_Ps15]|uniref:Uncharacterized protein n=1 Tax=Stenotrophomonas maltophilia phage vB_SmaM_Ps15 TaxID=3071007 RepID=A0AAE9JUV9_9CAUD|nr:hypothetical protein PQC01_gp041 [Stenotrophomonas maltophilia phage vB_SmaM_Ps15]UMO77192.1 hypothetical protein SmaMPs15_000041 [Stenotrophomonas maltophilia phage vB_SmaM_Ps15]
MTAYQARKAKNDSDARRFPKTEKQEAVVLKPEVGYLIRKGKIVYYTFVNGAYVESHDADEINSKVA